MHSNHVRERKEILVRRASFTIVVCRFYRKWHLDREKMSIQIFFNPLHEWNKPKVFPVCLSADWHVAGLLSVQDHHSQSVWDGLADVTWQVRHIKRSTLTFMSTMSLVVWIRGFDKKWQTPTRIWTHFYKLFQHLIEQVFLVLQLYRFVSSLPFSWPAQDQPSDKQR